ncbi:receptor like protein 33 [Striga hermonthica]|uniref:Receptor like protein 33 n=1 Tax=Striga hermonthica TaxID=68872 RepID=A0A9N7R3E5_STRHE|nr:receptor like protein 33 [Striga hermonthica]
MDVARNNLDGSMGTWIWTSLSGLKYLILRSNNFDGELNPSICQLTSLQILDLSNNRFSGVMPSCVDSFTAMTTTRSLPEGKFDYGAPGYSFYYGETGYSLHPRAFIESASINIKGNELHYDTILPLVTGIDLSENNFSGEIPREITSLVELKSLNLSGNNFTGTIPDNIGNMKQLESLDFSRNSLSGEIPNSFTTMTSLEYLNLSSNNLTGRIPESTQLRGFTESSFDGNNLCGPPLFSCTEEGEVVRAADAEREKREIEWFYVCLSLGYAVGLSLVVTAFMLKKPREAYYGFLQDTWDNVGGIESPLNRHFLAPTLEIFLGNFDSWDGAI